MMVRSDLEPRPSEERSSSCGASDSGKLPSRLLVCPLSPKYIFILLLFVANGATSASANRRLRAGLCFIHFRTSSGGFAAPVRSEHRSESVKFPQDRCWGMRGAPGRKWPKSHVWMNKRRESDGSAAEMEENTLPGATCKCLLTAPFEKLHACSVTYVLYHVLKRFNTCGQHQLYSCVSHF